MWKSLTSVLVFVILRGAVTVVLPSCNFDNGWCQWRALNNSLGFTWHMGHGPTVDRLSGPDGDHTTTHGKYIFIKGRDAHGNNRNACAVVESNVDITSDMQISFWYYMNGVGIGSLSLTMREENGSETTLWKRIGRKGPSWNQATADLPRGSYILSFAATVRLFYGSDLAIDDVEIVPITTTTNPPPTTLPPSSDLPFFCNFDLASGLCGIKLIPSLGDTVGWNLTSEKFAHKGYTYIHGDASGGTGKYLLLSNWNQGENGDAAQIVSPVFKNTGTACLSLQLYLARISSGTLSVYQRLLPTMELKLLHEEAYKDNLISGHWTSLMVTLRNWTYFQVVLEGSYTGYLGSVIGVDDIKIENGPCVHTTTSKPPTSTASPLSSGSSKSKPTTKFVTSTEVGISSKSTAKASLVPSTPHTLSTPIYKSSTPKSSSLTSLKATSSTTSPTSASTESPTTSPILSSTSTSSSSSSTTSTITSSTRTSVPSTLPLKTSHISSISSTSIARPTTALPVPSTADLSGSTSERNSMSSHNSSLLSSTQASLSMQSSPSSTISTILLTNTSTLSTSSLTQTLNSSSVRTTSSASNTPFLTHVPSVQSSPVAIKHTSTIKHASTIFTTEANIQTTKLKTELTTSPNESTSSKSFLSTSTSSPSISKIMSVLQSKTSHKSTIESSTTILHTPEVKSSTSVPTEASNSAGRGTTAIVLGVCLPIIALVIISVIVLICKKDNSGKLNSIHSQKKIRQKAEKYSSDTIEMNSKQNGVEHVQVTVKGFRKLET